MCTLARSPAKSISDSRLGHAWIYCSFNRSIWWLATHVSSCSPCHRSQPSLWKIHRVPALAYFEPSGSVQGQHHPSLPVLFKIPPRFVRINCLGLRFSSVWLCPPVSWLLSSHSRWSASEAIYFLVLLRRLTLVGNVLLVKVTFYNQRFFKLE